MTREDGHGVAGGDTVIVLTFGLKRDGRGANLDGDSGKQVEEERDEFHVGQLGLVGKKSSGSL